MMLTIRSVWSQLLSSIQHMRSVFSPSDAITTRLKKYALQLTGPAVEKIGWEPHSNEGLLFSQLRAMLITAAGADGHES